VHGLNALTEGRGREDALRRLAEWSRP